LSVTGSIATLTNTTGQTFASATQGASAPVVGWAWRNDGDANLTLMLGALNSPFSLSSNNCTAVPPGGTCSINVQMGTASVGTFSQSGISVTGAYTGNRSDLSLSGTVTAANSTVTGSPGTLAFGTVNKNALKDLVLTLSNTSAVAATGLTYSFSGTYAAYYSRVGGTCPAAGGTLAGNASCTVTVEDAAGCTAGIRNATLNTTGANFPVVATNLTATTGTSGVCN